MATSDAPTAPETTKTVARPNLFTTAPRRTGPPLLVRVLDGHAARLQGHGGVDSAGMGDEVIAVLVDRAREPAAGFALIGFQPVHRAGDDRIGGRHPGLPQDVGDQSGAVAVARSFVVLGSVFTLPVPERREIPAAVGALQREELRDDL